MKKEEFIDYVDHVKKYLAITDFDTLPSKIDYAEYILYLSELGSAIRYNRYDDAQNNLKALVYELNCNGENRCANVLYKCLNDVFK